MMMIETFEIVDDITTCYVQAASPVTIPNTFVELEKKVDGFNARHVYGVGGCLNGQFFYKACVTERTHGEALQLNLPYCIIPKGKYISIKLHNWRQNTGRITQLIDRLFEHPAAKPGSNCIEDYYGSDEMRLLVEHL